MRWHLITAMIAVVTLSTSAIAAEGPVVVAPDGPDTIDAFTREHDEDPVAPSLPDPRRRADVERDLVRVRDIAFGTNDAGERCVRVVSVWVDATNAPPEDSENARILRLADRYPLCPDSDPIPSAPAPNVLADGFWQDQVPLPRPEPTVQPDNGITGIPVYLQIGGPQQGSWRFETFGIEIVIDATSTYDIDWGDGTVQTGVTSQGGPYPDGDIVHGYRDKGTYDIVVTQRWTATWTARGNGVDSGGAIADVLQTVGIVDDFVVSEVQAVRER